MSWPRTWDEREDFDGHPLDQVECPGCGRVTHADVIVDLSPASVGGDWGCDACLDRLVANGRIKHSDLMAELGAPPKEVKEYRVREKFYERRRAADRRDEPFHTGKALEKARAEVFDGDGPPTS